MTDKGVSDLTQKIGLAAALAFAVSGGAAWASGDAAAGERAFNQCVACHVVKNSSSVCSTGTTFRFPALIKASSVLVATGLRLDVVAVQLISGDCSTMRDICSMIC